MAVGDPQRSLVETQEAPAVLLKVAWEVSNRELFTALVIAAVFHMEETTMPSAFANVVRNTHEGEAGSVKALVGECHIFEQTKVPHSCSFGGNSLCQGSQISVSIPIFFFCQEICSHCIKVVTNTVSAGSK